MHPIACKGISRGRLRLCYFVFMVGEYEVIATAVNVKIIPQILPGHGRTLNVPTRSSRPPRAFPGRLSRFGGFPEGKVHGVALPGVNLHPGPRLHILGGPPRQFSVAGKRSYVKINVFVHHVSMPPLYQKAHHFHYFRQVLGNPGVNIGP